MPLLGDCVDYISQNFFILMAAKSEQSSDPGWSTVNREVGNIVIHNEQNDDKKLKEECFKEETKIYNLSISHTQILVFNRYLCKDRLGKL